MQAPVASQPPQQPAVPAPAGLQHPHLQAPQNAQPQLVPQPAAQQAAVPSGHGVDGGPMSHGVPTMGVAGGMALTQPPPSQPVRAQEGTRVGGRVLLWWCEWIDAEAATAVREIVREIVSIFVWPM